MCVREGMKSGLGNGRRVIRVVRVVGIEPAGELIATARAGGDCREDRNREKEHR